jgi:hypothetical protein
MPRLDQGPQPGQPRSAAACAGRRSLCVRPSCIAQRPTCARSELGPAARQSTTFPRGTRSGPGYSVPVRHHLILLCRLFDEVVDIIGFFKNGEFLKNHVISIRYLLCDSVVLIGPMRPTRRHIAISPLGGLYAMPSLCGSAWRPASGSGLSLTIPSWYAVLSDPGEFDVDPFQTTTST